MAFWTEDPFTMPMRRHTFAEGPPVNRSSRSWTSNGVNYQVESTSYTSPNFAFGIMGSTSRPRAQPTSQRAENQPRSRGTGLLGTAINLIGAGIASRLAQGTENTERSRPRRSSVDDLAYGDNYSDAQKDTGFSNLPQRGRSDCQRERQGSARGQSPRRRRPQGGESRRSRSYRTQESQPSRSAKRSAYVEDYTDEESEYSDYHDKPRAQHSSHSSSLDDDSDVEALESVAKHHRDEAIRCKEKAQQLLQRPKTDPERIGRLVDEINKHEAAYENAREKVKAMQNKRRGDSRRQQQSHRPRASATFSFGTSQSGAFSQDDFDSFFFGGIPRSQRSPFGQQAGFEDFDSFLQSPFGAFFQGPGRDPMFGNGFIPSWFSMNGTSFHAGPQPNARSVPRGNAFPSQGGPSMFTPRPQPKPPANLLKPEEAKQLFKIYNEKWNSLGPTDPNIPYPARRLHPSGLLTRDSIWAPQVSSAISEWSEETVMQANVQAFYLGVVGLSPNYTEAPGSGKIVMGYSKPKATPAQMKSLIDILKKEKARWHSDRLGRRNGGGEGPNEALQRDEKARAVFHAVCELMEAAQGS